MKNFAILLTIFTILSSCVKDTYSPINNVNTCLDTCGTIIAATHYMNDYPIITSILIIETSCDSIEITSIHTIEEICYYPNMYICFNRN
tara:strand:+ start:194 stop:460 length:267 start_codon:yes stop_codon:yes gene_type:complete